MPRYFHIVLFVLFLLSLNLVQGQGNSTLTGEIVTYQVPKPTDRYPLSVLRLYGFRAVEGTNSLFRSGCIWLKKRGRIIAKSSTELVKAVPRVCRYLHASRNYQKITRQGRKTAGYSSRYTLRSPTSLGMVGSASQHSLVPFLDFPPSRTTEIQDIARLAGLGVEEVPALALRLEGPVRRTQDLVSDALEFPHEVALLLWWETLRLWRVFGYGFWGLKLGCGFLLFLCGCWFGNGNRVAIKLILLGLCGLFSGLSLGYLLPACVIICLIARLD